MIFDVITLFPEMFAAIADYGVSSRALKKGLAELLFVNPREFTSDVHRTVDDRPYGGGPGMVMLPDPMLAAIESAKGAIATDDLPDPRVVYVSPQGTPFTQKLAEKAVAVGAPIVFVAGRYEGVDERIIELSIDEEWSLGDYVLSGGELPAMVMIDTMLRLVPGVLGHQGSAEQDSFADELLDCPHYTRPEEYRGHRVPDVLLSGNHERIRKWRLQQALGRTFLRRPDLLERKLAEGLTDEEAALLAEFKSKL